MIGKKREELKPTASLKYFVDLTAIFAGGSFIATIFRIFGGVLTARVVDPAVLGLFNGFNLVLGYAPFLQVGILNGLNRELPYYIGKGEYQKSQSLAAAGQAWALLVGGACMAGLFGLAAWSAVLGKSQTAAGWATMAINVMVLFYGTLYLQITFRTGGDFARLSLINIIQNGAALFLVILAWWLSFYGLCLRSILVGLVFFSLLFYWRPLPITPCWNKQHLWHLFKIGLPIFFVGQLYAWWVVLDSTLVLKYLGAHSLGLYSLSILFGASLQLLPDSFSQIIYPKMAEEYGRNGRLKSLVKMAYQPIILLVMVMIPLLILGWFLIPVISRTLLPKYIEGIEAAQWSLIPAGIMSLAPINNAFTVVKRLDIYGVIVFCSILSYIVCLMVLISNNPYLAAFPQAMLVGKIIFIILSYGCLKYLCHREEMITAQ